MLIVWLALTSLLKILPMFKAPKPAEKPANYPADGWPLYFVGAAFVHNRRFGMFFLLGLILDLVIKLIIRN